MAGTATESADPPAEGPDSNHNNSNKKANPPPPVITVDTTTSNDEDNNNGNTAEGSASGKTTPDMKTMGQARTPKHANKSRDDDTKDNHAPHSAKSQITPDRQTNIRSTQSNGGPPRPPYGGFSPPRPYEGRPLGGSGAFQPHESRQSGPPGRDPGYYSNGRPPMHVSPPHGHGDYRPPGYYGGPPPEYHRGGPGGSYPPYDRGGPPPYHEGGPPPPHHRGPPGSQYRGPPPPYPPSYSNGYDQGYQGQGPPAPQYGRRPPPYPGMPSHEYNRGPDPPAAGGRYHEAQQQGASGNFSRTISSSFGSRTDEKPHAGPPGDGKQDHYMPPPHGGPPPADSGSLGEQSDDNSWKQLNQVASVDEAVMRERIEKQDGGSITEGRLKAGDHPGSNSSSLTNSPTEGHAAADKKRASIPTPSKLASLDSLSSVASAQEPLTTSNKDKTTIDSNHSVGPTHSVGANNSVGHLSPGSSASLDLMKCSSGSSGLLHLASQGLSFPPPDGRLESKRSRDDDSVKREDAPTTDGMDSKSTGTTEAPPAKRAKDSKYKESPLSIACSPPTSPPGKNKGHRKTGSSASYLPIPSSKQERYLLHQSPGYEGAYFDRPPSYNYSMDSAPPFPKESQRPAGYPPLPHRPGSSSSSTITPMVTDGHEQPHGVGPSLPSWEIQQQDSFSGGSAGGGAPLMNSFSFTQDYPMLSSSGSNLGNNYTEHGSNMPPIPPPGNHAGNPPPPVMNPQIESRNQSFEGGHYHGSFSRTESMDMSYGSRPPPPHGHYNAPPGQHHHGGYIHHAPSWGSHGPPPGAPGHYGQYPPPPRIAHSGSFQQSGPGPMMRNYSEERVSPPPGPPGMRAGGPPGRTGFQPPPEFMAPHNPQLSRRPQQAVYLMSSPPGGHGGQQKASGGNFSWSKEDDSRLTEIMKKYKNPRDWEPIAKEHGRGRT